MKKHLFEILIVIFIIIEVILMSITYVDKYEIAKIIKIDNINDFSVKKLKESKGPGSESPIFIKFKISSNKYKEYNLRYQDEISDDYIYEGEITNKKQKISDNYYMCYYESIIYDNKEKEQFREIMSNRFLLKVNSMILIFLLFVYITRKIMNIINQKKC